MALVVSDMSISLDGYVTGPNDSRENPFGDGAGTLHDWLFDASTEADRALLDAAVVGTGAIVMGRRSFDKCVDMWGENGPLGGLPCFVVTHREPPARCPSVYRFVHDGAAKAIELATEAAGERAVGLHGATVLQQALPLGLVDEIFVHVVPLLIGGGTSLFATLGSAITLERLDAVVTPAATHLRYRVVN
ncbi:dihydrofolate reductase family protein [Prauserella cavernicola]|uniref:Dihydrofolate reductase family protein n=1 Tax=Prauserella cavernicola TaxID=2800127 RepID=A0A934V1R2_9PSEU|nr:dihydrofolate reductase family protein [Prauserella cavernicola]MBK1783731.1 dihydrofolate reductase family protein [Prauserella cavernicola]